MAVLLGRQVNQVQVAYSEPVRQLLGDGWYARLLISTRNRVRLRPLAEKRLTRCKASRKTTYKDPLNRSATTSCLHHD